MVINNPIHFCVNNCDPRRELWAAICKYVNKDPKWLPCYEKVAEWLGDNQSRGLICNGPSSLGKSVICAQALPYLFRRHFNIEARVVQATDMCQQIDKLLQYCGDKRVIVVDDLGQEPASVYGRRPFFELVNKAEITGTLLIISTNLRTTKHATIQYPSIEERYGVPTLDRLRAITHVVKFEGTSMRG